MTYVNKNSIFFKSFIFFIVFIILFHSFSVSYAEIAVSSALAYKAFIVILGGMGIYEAVENKVGIKKFYDDFIEKYKVVAELKRLVISSIRNNIKMKTNDISKDISEFYFDTFKDNSMPADFVLFNDVTYKVLNKRPDINIYGFTVQSLKEIRLGQVDDKVYTLALMSQKYGFGLQSGIILAENGKPLKGFLRPLNKELWSYLDNDNIVLTNLSELYLDNDLAVQGSNYSSVNNTIKFNVFENSIKINWRANVDGKIEEVSTIKGAWDSISNYSFFDEEGNNIISLLNNSTLEVPEIIEEVAFPLDQELDLKNFIGKSVDEIIEAIDNNNTLPYRDFAKEDSTTILENPVKTLELDEEGLISDVKVKEVSIPKTISKIYNAILNLPGEIVRAFQNFFEGFFVPTKTIDFAPLQIKILKSKFPFCLPFDLFNVFKSLSTSPIIPSWEINILGNTFLLDFAIFESLAVIVRWGICIIFIISLIKFYSYFFN